MRALLITCLSVAMLAGVAGIYSGQTPTRISAVMAYKPASYGDIFNRF